MPEPSAGDIGGLEIRIGKIVNIVKHQDADQLYVSTVDVGEAEPRTIVSGLVKYCSIDSLLDSQVVVLCNLKPRPLKGIMSFGMLLCASNSDHSEVIPLRPPPDSRIGEPITFSGHNSNPIPPSNRANKIFEKIVSELKVSSSGEATFSGIPFMTPKGPCTSTIIGNIS